MDFLSVAERALILQDVADLTADAQLAVSATYRDHTGRTFTPETGVFTETFTDVALTVVRNVVSVREVQAGQGLYQMGDVRLMIDAAALGVTPRREDRVVIAGTTYELISWEQDPVGALWNVVVREVMA